MAVRENPVIVTAEGVSVLLSDGRVLPGYVWDRQSLLHFRGRWLDWGNQVLRSACRTADPERRAHCLASVRSACAHARRLTGLITQIDAAARMM